MRVVTGQVRSYSLRKKLLVRQTLQLKSRLSVLNEAEVVTIVPDYVVSVVIVLVFLL